MRFLLFLLGKKSKKKGKTTNKLKPTKLLSLDMQIDEAILLYDIVCSILGITKPPIVSYYRPLI